MADLLIIAALLSFLAFLAAPRLQQYAALAGWACIVLNLWTDVPAFLREDNILYPALAVLSLPFLAITAGGLLSMDRSVIRLSRTAAIATVIYIPFALVPFLRDALVSVVVTLVFRLVTALGHRPWLTAWDVIAENAFANQIVPACTGIMAIAIVLGAVLAEKGLTARQAVLSVILVVPGIFLANLLRVTAVFIAVSGRWFDGFPDPTGTGDANFFWAHNVIAEGLALLFLFLLMAALVRIVPSLGVSARAVWDAYTGRLRMILTPARDEL